MPRLVAWALVNVRNWLLGAAFAVALAGQAVSIATSWGGAYWVFDCAVGAVVCAFAVVRQRHLAGTAAAGLLVAAMAIVVAQLAGLPTEPGPAMALGLAVLTGAAVRRLPIRLAGAIAAGGLAVVAGSFATAWPPPSSAVPTLSALFWLAGVACGLGLRLLAARRRATAERVRQDERLELARELHDVVAHHITGIVVQAQAAQLVARKQPDQLDESLDGIARAGTDALAAMRRVVGLLRTDDDAAPAAPGPEQLSELVDRFRSGGRTVSLRLPDDDTLAWPPEVTSTIYRVVQESLTNIAKHAPQAGSVTVSVTRNGPGLTVEVTDDGPPAPARHHRGGYGLVGMRERLELLGGTLDAGPRTGAGWSVVATLPRLERPKSPRPRASSRSRTTSDSKPQPTAAELSTGGRDR
jgi:signal transduction histidine kinase